MIRNVRTRTAALAVVCLVLAGTGARRGEVRPTAIAIQPLVDPAPAAAGGDPGSRTDPLADGGPLVAQLVLSVTPGMDVRWRPVDPGGPSVLALVPPPVIPSLEAQDPDPDSPRSPLPAIRVARAMLESLPRSWRKRSLKRMEAMELEGMDEARAGLMVDALAARAAGDPLRGAALLGEALEGAAPEALPVLRYLLGACLVEGGREEEAAAALAGGGDSLERLPGPMVSAARAVVDAAGGERDRAVGRLTSVAEGQPGFSEAFLLRARLSRRWCDLYDQQRIIQDLDDTLRGSPCSPLGSLELAEMVAFTGRPDTAPARLRSEAGCVQEPLDAVRERALALAFAAAGSLQEAMAPAARAEALDVSALRRGLAPAYLLAGDHAHLDELYDPEADLHLPPGESVEHHLHSGLNALWSGRPSRAAELFERAEEHQSGLEGGGDDQSAMLQLLRHLRIRAYLTAGRVTEAVQASADAREAGRGEMNGLLIYSTGLADLASGDRDQAVTMTRRLTLAGLKFWRYLLDAEIALREGDSQGAQSALSLASQGIGFQTTVCPGVAVEPYMLQAQGRALLALGRLEAAQRVLERLVESGSRGLLAPDILVPSYGLLARAREAAGDRQGALQAWEVLLSRWGQGEETPAVQEARREAQRLRPGS